METLAQPTVNIGMVGHVDHGKTTLTKTLTGEWTDRHSEEIKRGISIRLGYADANIFKCPRCEAPKCYGTQSKCRHCGSETNFLRAVSFVDAPGHETLMATMISGAAIMDGSLLLIAANEPCPQPQTIEHLMALEIAGVKNVIVIQNKIDLLSKEKLLDHYRQIKDFLNGSWIEDAPVIPISAHHDVNIDVLIEAIEDFIPTPKLDASQHPQMNVARSFDVNRPGTNIDGLTGGVLGGSLKRGVLRIGDEIEIRPGLRTPGDASQWEAMFTEVVSLMAGGRSYEEIKPGGLAGIGTLLDPYYTKADNLIGNLIGTPGTLPSVLSTMTLDVHLLDQMVISHGFGPGTTSIVEPISSNTPLMLSVGTATTVGVVTSAREDVIDVKLKLAVCAKEGTKVAISRREGGRWRLIGYGVIQ